jgi:hypothetical protein
MIDIPFSPSHRRQPWVDAQVLATGKWVQAGKGKGKEDCAVM